MNFCKNFFVFISEDKRAQLLQYSFLMLFVQLTLIRWAGANIYYLFAFANFILIASFLGIGIGFLRSNSLKNYFQYSPIFLAAIIYFCYKCSYQYQPVLNPITDNLDYTATYFKKNFFPIWITLPTIFLMVTALMAMLADGAARAFKQLQSLQAYRYEILGSLLGVVTFSLLSFIHAGPIAWGLIISFLFLLLLFKQWKSNSLLLIILQIAALSLTSYYLTSEATQPRHFWSSYYKIVVQEFSKKRYVINVNGLAQQIIESVSKEKK